MDDFIDDRPHSTTCDSCGAPCSYMDWAERFTCEHCGGPLRHPDYDGEHEAMIASGGDR